MANAIPSAALEILKGLVAKAAKKALKLGLPLPVVEVLGFFVTPVPDGIDVETGAKKVRYVEMANVLVTGEAPYLAGWTFLGTIQRVVAEGETLAIVRSVPGREIPAEFRDGKDAGRCDHCRTVRHRIDTYVVGHEDGTTKLVGSNCLADFFPGMDPASFAGYAASLADIRAMVEAEEKEGGMGGGRHENVTPLVPFLAQVSACIRKDGWTSRTAANNNPGLKATADKAWSAIFPTLFDRKLWKDDPSTVPPTPTEADAEFAAKAIEWALGLTADNDYLHNLLVIAKLGYTSGKLAGYAASMATAYNKELAARVAREKVANSEWVGEIKSKVTFTGTLLGVNSIDSYYGTTHVTKFADDKGNVFTWFASNLLDLPVGTAVKVTGTVKKHDEFRGVKSTVVTRCKVTAVPAAVSLAA